MALEAPSFRASLLMDVDFMAIVFRSLVFRANILRVVVLRTVATGVGVLKSVILLAGVFRAKVVMCAIFSIELLTLVALRESGFLSNGSPRLRSLGMELSGADFFRDVAVTTIVSLDDPQSCCSSWLAWMVVNLWDPPVSPFSAYTPPHCLSYFTICLWD